MFVCENGGFMIHVCDLTFTRGQSLIPQVGVEGCFALQLQPASRDTCLAPESQVCGQIP